MIEAGPPGSWRQLQDKVTQILRECGYEAYSDHEIETVRGTVKVDVWARDGTARPPSITLGECKHWKRAVSKNTVHGFRTVIQDSGAHIGLLISSKGFQRGAVEAAGRTNVHLATWEDFQSLFVNRWIRRFMLRTLHRETEAYVDYTEPFNARIVRKERALTRARIRDLRRLRRRYSSMWLLMLIYSRGTLLRLPLRRGRFGKLELSADILDATAYRPLLDACIAYCSKATLEFDDIFGGPV